MAWTPLISFFALILIFTIGSEISLKTESIISLMFVSAVFHLLGYWTGLIPTDSVANTGLPYILSGFVVPIMVINVGTMMDVNQLMGEWKTVLICLAALVGLIFACFTVGVVIFGSDYELVAVSPIAGGGVATILVGDACLAAGRDDLAGYAALLNSMQLIMAMPISAFMIKRQIASMQKEGVFVSEEILRTGAKLPLVRRRYWKSAPAWWTRPYPILLRVTLMAILGVMLSNVTRIPAAVLYLILGVLACQFGFLEPNSLQNAGYWPFLMIVQLCNVPYLLASVTLDQCIKMLIPVFGMLALGVVSLSTFGILFSKLIRVPWKTAMAVALCAMIGYPSTMLISEDAVSTMNASENEKMIARGYVLPKMLVAGFTSVSTVSIIIAGIMVPYLSNTL